MNCPVCDRSLAPTLSICPSCGAMMYDTVREELQSKITPGAAPRVEMPPKVEVPRPSPPVRRVETTDLVAPKTSPTLVEFQNKNAPLPDWRIQLQNAVKQRKGCDVEAAAAPQLAVRPAVATRPAAAVEPTIADQRVANAMRRIEQSQKTFHRPEKPRRPKPPQPFGVVAGSAAVAAAAAPARIPVVHPPQPKLVPPPPAVAEKRVTNKLPFIDDVAPEVEQPTVEIKKPFAAPQPIAKVERLEEIAPKLDFPEAVRIEIKADERKKEIEAEEFESDDIDDLAPWSMRFGAGLFDLIIAGFGSLLLLSPVAFAGTNWWTATGLLTFAGTLAAVAFIYMTLCIGFFGKTIGMRLFSLELVDALENEYPTLRQAAVNSFLFLVSLPFGGAGFLTALFNEENRAVHDIMSGTIMVREF